MEKLDLVKLPYNARIHMRHIRNTDSYRGTVAGVNAHTQRPGAQPGHCRKGTRALVLCSLYHEDNHLRSCFAGMALTCVAPVQWRMAAAVADPLARRSADQRAHQ